ASRRAAGQLRDAADRSPAGRRREPRAPPRVVPGRVEPDAPGRRGPAAPGGHPPAGICPGDRARATVALPSGGLLVRGDLRQRSEGTGPADGGDRRTPRTASAAFRGIARPRAPGRAAVDAAG